MFRNHFPDRNKGAVALLLVKFWASLSKPEVSGVSLRILCPEYVDRFFKSHHSLNVSIMFQYSPKISKQKLQKNMQNFM